MKTPKSLSNRKGQKVEKQEVRQIMKWMIKSHKNQIQNKKYNPTKKNKRKKSKPKHKKKRGKKNKQNKERSKWRPSNYKYNYKISKLE